MSQLLILRPSFRALSTALFHTLSLRNGPGAHRGTPCRAGNSACKHVVISDA